MVTNAPIKNRTAIQDHGPVRAESAKYPVAESKHPVTRAGTAPSLAISRGNTNTDRTIPTDGAAPAVPKIQLGCPHASNVNDASG